MMPPDDRGCRRITASQRFKISVLAIDIDTLAFDQFADVVDEPLVRIMVAKKKQPVFRR